MDLFTVSFFGHRVIDNPFPIEKAIDRLIASLLRENEYVEFLVGRNGEFDQLVSSAIKRCKRTVRDDNSSHVWVLPYVTADYRTNKNDYRNYYDEIEIFANQTVHFKAAYQCRNESMIDRSNLVVFFVEHESGGAAQALRYAIKKGKHYINLAEKGL